MAPHDVGGVMFLATIAPHQLGAMIRETAQRVTETGERLDPAGALYAEKRGGFQCGTCLYAGAVNATHGRCQVVQGTVHLSEGCCVMWTADPAQLHLYREP